MFRFFYIKFFMTKENIKYCLDYMKRLYPSNVSELIFETPYQFLVAVCLSAQTTDKQVNKVTKNIFEKIKTPQDLINFWEKNFEENIKTLGFFRAKAKNIYKWANQIVDYTNKILREKNWLENLAPQVKQLYEKYGYILPDNIKDLTSFWWVWEKTAKVFLHWIYGQDLVGADTHVHRVSNRLGFVKTCSPIQTWRQLEKILPQEYLSQAHHCILLFWRYFCKALKPNCPECELKNLCLYYKKNHLKKQSTN